MLTHATACSDSQSMPIGLIDMQKRQGARPCIRFVVASLRESAWSVLIEREACYALNDNRGFRHILHAVRGYARDLAHDVYVFDAEHGVTPARCSRACWWKPPMTSYGRGVEEGAHPGAAAHAGAFDRFNQAETRPTVGIY